MSTDTIVQDLIINTLTKEDFENLGDNASDTELYLVEDDTSDYLTSGDDQDVTGLITFLNTRFQTKTDFSETEETENFLEFSRIIDSQDNRIGLESINKRTDGGVYRFIRADQNTGDNKGKYCGLGMVIYENGTARMYYSCNGTVTIPDTGNSIPNMDKVNSRIKTLAVTEFGNNYIKFGNNAYAQWKKESYTAARDHSATVTFPKPFTSAPIVVGIPELSAIDTNPNVACGVNSVTTTNFKYRCYGYGSSDKSDGFFWIAIGK